MAHQTNAVSEITVIVEELNTAVEGESGDTSEDRSPVIGARVVQFQQRRLAAIRQENTGLRLKLAENGTHLIGLQDALNVANGRAERLQEELEKSNQRSAGLQAELEGETVRFDVQRTELDGERKQRIAKESELDWTKTNLVRVRNELDQLQSQQSKLTDELNATRTRLAERNRLLEHVCGSKSWRLANWLRGCLRDFRR